MDSFFFRFKNSLVLMALLLAQTIGLAIQVRRPIETGAADSPKVNLARSWCRRPHHPRRAPLLEHRPHRPLHLGQLRRPPRRPPARPRPPVPDRPAPHPAGRHRRRRRPGPPPPGPPRLSAALHQLHRRRTGHRHRRLRALPRPLHRQGRRRRPQSRHARHHPRRHRRQGPRRLR